MQTVRVGLGGMCEGGSVNRLIDEYPKSFRHGQTQMSSYGVLLKQASSVQISHNVPEGDLGFRIGYAGNPTTHTCSAYPYPHRCMFVAFSHPVDDLDGIPAATCSSFTEERDQHGGSARHPHPNAMLGAGN